LSDGSDDVAWHWLAPDGKAVQGSDSELREKLASRSLAPSTRVWRSGWAEWLPANRTAELSRSLPPGTKLTPREPRLDPAATSPPDPKQVAVMGSSATPPRVASVAARAPARPSKPPLPTGLGQVAARTPSSLPPAAQRPPPAPQRPPSAAPAAPSVPAPKPAAIAVPKPPAAAAVPGAPKPPAPRGSPPSTGAALPNDSVNQPSHTLRPPSAVPPPPSRPAAPPVGHQPLPPPPRSSPQHSPPASVIVSGVPSDAPGPAPSPQLPPGARAAQPGPGASRASEPEIVARAAGSEDLPEVEADDIGAVLSAPRPAPDATPLPAFAPNPVPNEAAPLPAFTASSPPPAGLPAPGASTGAPTPPAIGNLRVALVVVSLMAAALVVLLLVSLLTRDDDDDDDADNAPSAVSATAAASVATSVVAKGCALAVPAAKLAATVERSISPNLLTLADGRVAVGFAAKPTQASGVIVDLKTLDTQAVFDEPGESAVRNVAPSAESSVSFRVTRENDTLVSPRSIDGAPHTLLGFTKDGLAKSVGGGAPEGLWSTATDKVTEARAARAEHGYLVAFRRGGLAGNILAGWLGPDLTKKSELEVVPAGVRYVGTPVVAAHPRAALLAFAGRDDENADWRIRFARAEGGQIPRAVSDFALPPGGPGGGAIAPSLAALDEDRWVLQWTEGGSGQYQVRVQELTGALAPVGSPALASPKGASAGQGAVWIAGDRALSLFVLTVGGYDELWGAALECR
jgi:hypothetical protein